MAGLRIKDGIIEYIPDNKAASSYCDLSRDSEEWQQVKTNRGPVRVNVECGDIAIVDLPEHEEYEPDYDGVRIEELEVELSEIPQALRDLGIIPEKRAEEENKTYVYFDATEGEYLPLRGSAFRDASFSGPSALGLDYLFVIRGAYPVCFNRLYSKVVYTPYPLCGCHKCERIATK